MIWGTPGNTDTHDGRRRDQTRRSARLAAVLVFVVVSAKVLYSVVYIQGGPLEVTLKPNHPSIIKGCLHPARCGPCFPAD